MLMKLPFTLTPAHSIIAGIALLYILMRMYYKRKATNAFLVTQMKTLNEKTHFHTDIEKEYHLEKRYKDRAYLNTISILTVMDHAIEQDIEKYITLACHVKENEEEYEEYLKKYDALIKETFGDCLEEAPFLFRRTYRRAQTKKLAEMKMSIPQRPVFIVTARCEDYSTQRELYWENFLYELQLVENRVDEYKKRKVERCKMTLKMRYRVLREDNFRCVKCGRSSLIVPLEVDHIIPVSKGGKTVRENLQTLCRDCNRGKGVSAS